MLCHNVKTVHKQQYVPIQGTTTRHKTCSLTLSFSEDNLKRPGWTLVSHQDKVCGVHITEISIKYTSKHDKDCE